MANADTENGVRIQQWKANNFGAQEWLIEQHPEAPGTVTLVSFISGLVMEVADGSTEEGGTVQQWEDTDSPSSGGGWSRCRPDRAAGRRTGRPRGGQSRRPRWTVRAVSR